VRLWHWARAGGEGITPAGSEGAHREGQRWGPVVSVRHTECTQPGTPAFVRSSVCSPYRHLVAILKEDKETFGFEIQVRLKGQVDSFENKIRCKLVSVASCKLGEDSAGRRKIPVSSS